MSDNADFFEEINMSRIFLSILVLVTLVLALSACAQQQTVWNHAHGSAAQFERDKLQCEYESAQGTASYSQGATARTNSGAFAQGVSEGLTIAARRNELGMLCMRARGYYQVQ